MAAFFTYLALLLQFWKEVKFLLNLLKKTPKEKRDKLKLLIKEASDKADMGDTSGYEDLIQRGRQ